MNIVRWFKAVGSFVRYFPHAIVEHWKRSRKEAMLMSALGTEKGRRALAEALARPIRKNIFMMPKKATPDEVTISISKTLEILNKKLANPRDWDQDTLKACAEMKARLETNLAANGSGKS